MTVREWLQKRLVTIQQERFAGKGILLRQLRAGIITRVQYWQGKRELTDWANRHWAATWSDLVRLEKGIA